MTILALLPPNLGKLIRTYLLPPNLGNLIRTYPPQTWGIKGAISQVQCIHFVGAIQSFPPLLTLQKLQNLYLQLYYLRYFKTCQ
jgi:hypothetical protein